jgi:ABC-type multidrug transport system fused ATPase/permease subunit
MAGARRSYNSNGKQKDETAKVKISKESLSQALILFSYLKPYKAKFILSLVFIALSAFTTALFPLFLGKMIDAASPGATVSGMGGNNVGSEFGFNLKDVHWSLNTTLILIFIQLSIQTVFSFMRVYLLTEVGEKSLADMRKMCIVSY